MEQIHRKTLPRRKRTTGNTQEYWSTRNIKTWIDFSIGQFEKQQATSNKNRLIYNRVAGSVRYFLYWQDYKYNNCNIQQWWYIQGIISRSIFIPLTKKPTAKESEFHRRISQLRHITEVMIWIRMNKIWQEHCGTIKDSGTRKVGKKELLKSR